MHLVSVIIPIYKSHVNDNEVKSLKQCFKILGSHHIVLVCSKSLNISSYKSIAAEFHKQLLTERFSDEYFLNIQGYNRLMLSLEFYNRFGKFEYILICQLDAWVFRDELVFWCQKGYDYIGAPWFEGWHDATKESNFIGVGNGGFSLRNVNKSLEILKRVRLLKLYSITHRIFFIERFISFEKIILWIRVKFKIKNASLVERLLMRSGNEDFFWTMLVAKTFDDYKVPTLEDAMKFSFENIPSHLYKLNNNQLPFGCHAWMRYEKDFWQEFIPYET